VSAAGDAKKKRRSDFGSVRELPSGRYRGTYRVSGVEYVAPRTFRTKTDAKVYLGSVRSDLVRGAWIDPHLSRMTVKEVGEKWLASNPNKSESALARDKIILKTHVYPKAGGRPVGNVGRDQIQSMVNGWTGKPSSVRRQFTCMSALFKFAELNEWILRSPCRKIVLPKVVKADRHLLTPAEIANLAKAMDKRFRASVWVAAETGLRWNEIYGLQIDDVDTEGRTLTISRGLSRTGTGASVIGNVGSVKAEPRTISISAQLSEVLVEHVDRLEVRTENAWLFPDAEGGLVRYSNWRSRHWLTALKTAGLSDVVPKPGLHDLRRLSATRMHLDKVDLPTVMHRMGHKTASMSLEVYAQSDRAADQAQAETMASYVFSEMSHVGRTT
jgi:integrase